MKTIIAGGRDFENYDILKRELKEYRFKITEVVCGCANGADALGERWAIEYDVPVKKFPADWSKHGKAAGPIRNKQMAEYADYLIAFWDLKSRGTANMIKQMEELQKPFYVFYY